MGKEKIDLSIYQNAQASKNKTAMAGVFLMNVVLIAAYFMEVIKGTRGWLSYLLIFFMCSVPCLISLILYHRKKDSGAIRYVCGLGFLLFYAYVMFTTTSDLTFCYAIVIFVILMVYVDIRFLSLMGIGAITINVIRIGQKVMAGQLEGVQTTNAEITLACLILTGGFVMLALKKISAITQANIDRADSEKQQSEQLLDKTLHIASVMTDSIQNAVGETDVLKEAIRENRVSMEELSTGTEEAVVAIAVQNESTKKINQYVKKVESAVTAVVQEVNDAEENLTVSDDVMKDLLKQVRISEESGSTAKQKMDELKVYADKMQNIIMMIKKVAEQTSLLALNASIEAARAGEAGRGFAVVASQISELSVQSNQATEDVNKIIADILASVESVTSSMEMLLSSSQLQNQYVDSTDGNFRKIRTNTEGIKDQVEYLKEAVEVMTTENALVVQQINNVDEVVSGVEDKVKVTLDISNENLRSIANVTDIMDVLAQSAEKLQS